jgi:DNA polymerase IV
MNRSSLRQSKSVTAAPSESPMIHEVLPRLNSEGRAISNPTIGSASLILPYSMGIKSMLGSKRKGSNCEQRHGRKRACKDVSITLVPEDQRIFKDCTFYYIPSDDTAPLRRIRITKAREYGVNWTKVLTQATTHVVVDKLLTYNDVMEFLKLEIPPKDVIMVNEDYPIDCISSRFLLDPIQERYSINKLDEIKQGVESHSAGENANASLQFKATKSRLRESDCNPPNQTPPRSQYSTQVDQLKQNADIASHTDSWDVSTSATSNTALSERRLLMQISSGVDFDGSPCAGSLHDELNELINVARTLKDIPLSDDEDGHDNRPPSREESEDSGSEESTRRHWSRGKSKTNDKSKNTSFSQENFSCMTGGTGAIAGNNPNTRTIEVLQKMADIYMRSKDEWRHISYRKAIGTLKKWPVKITSYEQAVAIPTIGDRIAKKIEEIVFTNRLRRLENALTEPSDRILQTFMEIYGVGLKQGWAWVMQGHKTLEDLKAHADLTPNQLLGIKHYDDLLTRIPREEVTALGNIVKTHSADIDSEVEVIIGGSYRRGALSSGDIDCLVTKPGTSSSVDLLPFLKRLVARLTAIGFLVAALAVSSGKGSGSKWHGCCVLPGSPNPIWRRIDFLLVPQTELGAALIYFTGDDIFNRSIRLLSGRKGWRLNQRGLYRDVMRGPGRNKVTEGTLIEGADEKKIFAILGVPWRPPEQRICH